MKSVPQIGFKTNLDMNVTYRAGRSTSLDTGEEKQRFECKSSTVSLDTELEHDENTEWLQGCKWPTEFARKPIHLIVAAAALLLSYAEVPFAATCALRARTR
jgi:hypothetical protein